MKSRLLLSSIHAECMHDDEPESVFLDYKKILMTLTNLLVFSTTEPFKVKVNPRVAAARLNDAESKAYSEFIEHLSDVDDAYTCEPAVVAPYGGPYRKKHMDEQAIHIAQRISSMYVSLSMCKGFKKGADPFDSWHVTFTDFMQITFSAYCGSVLATELLHAFQSLCPFYTPFLKQSALGQSRLQQTCLLHLNP